MALARTLATVCLYLAAWAGTGPRAPAAGDAPRPAAKRAGPDWWSFQNLTRPGPPAVRGQGWVRNPIDVFVLAALEGQRLEPAPAADRTTLIRRASYDLLGLPPTPGEIDAFVNDARPDAYEKLIDHLLASPRYGERWGRHWLDVARFGESQGFERDKIRDHAWRYRDYVIGSFNDDKPYNRFVQEQLAGDVLEPVTTDGIVATGFLVAGPWDEVGATQQGALMRMRAREEDLEDVLSAVGQTFLGMTVNCARCHNHKFDPIPARDYYRLKAAFEGVRHGDRPLLTPDQDRARREQVARLGGDVARLEKQVADLEQEGRTRVLRERGPAVPSGAPRPLARWTFESDARDVVGALHGTLHGGAVVAGGRLRLNGKDAFVQTAPLPRDVRAKTLEAWVAVSDLKQRGGGVITLQGKGGHVFDAVVFGEREPMKWLAGSDAFNRTRDLDAPAETAAPGDLVHVAAVYDTDQSIRVYRNGVPYGSGYVPAGGPRAGLDGTAAGEAHVLFGLRHTGAGNGFFAGEVEEARLYDRALTPQEVAASFRAGVEAVPLERALEALSAEQRRRHAALSADLRRQREALQTAGTPALAYAANAGPPDPTFVLLRGDVENRREQVSGGGLSVIQSPPADFGLALDAPEGQRRLKLAQWIASADNPLTARVMVNRVWHYHFGRGIVGTPNDFGFNGERPSHPQLLDWLAAELIARGWSVKGLHRLIMLSSTYRQSSRFDPRAHAVDADNRLLWRFEPRRLEGEAVRDAMLAVSGQINLRMGGPSFRPFNLKIFNSHFYEMTDPVGPEYNRRTVYRINVNSAKSPLLDSLDCPDPSVKTPRRSITTTPLQALGLMNNSFVLRQARCFAERLRKEAGEDAEAQVTRAYRLALGRKPGAEEVKRAAALAREHGLEDVCWALLNANEFLYVK